LRSNMAEIVKLKNLETHRYVFCQADKNETEGSEGGWIQPKTQDKPLIGADANYYNRAMWEVEKRGEDILLRNHESRRLVFDQGPKFELQRGAEGGWIGPNTKKALSADANYYNLAIWKVQHNSNGSISLINTQTKRMLFDSGDKFEGAAGAEGGWIGAHIKPLLTTDANYYNRAMWVVEGSNVLAAPPKAPEEVAQTINYQDLITKRQSDLEKLKKVDVAAIPRAASGIVIQRFKLKDKKSEDYQYRMNNGWKLLYERWDWYVNNIGTFVNLLREQGYSDQEISDCIHRKRFLGFASVENFEEYKSDIVKILKDIEATTPVKNFRCILQGSNIAGYSSNPLKGSRSLPDYVYDAKLGSDMDFRILGDNIPQLIDQIRSTGVEIATKVGGERSHILEPSSVSLVFPQFQPLIDKHGGSLQVIVYMKDVIFFPCPWEYVLL